MSHTILHQERRALHRVPPDIAGLVQVDVENEAQENSRKVSFQQFLEKFFKVNFVKSFGKVKEAAVNF